MRVRSLYVLIPTALLAGCASSDSNLPRGAAAYSMFPKATADAPVESYKIGPLDVIAITVFQEPDLTVKDVQVDASGNVVLPLIGQLQASGKSSTELAALIAARLSRQYLENPQVSVIVQEAVSQRVTVQGSVMEPGVYEIRGQMTLLDAIAMAKGTSRVAALDRAAIFREIDGKRQGALFDLRKIYDGDAANPQIHGNDTVVIGLSNVKSAWRDVLTASPLLAIFRPF